MLCDDCYTLNGISLHIFSIFSTHQNRSSSSPKYYYTCSRAKHCRWLTYGDFKICIRKSKQCRGQPPATCSNVASGRRSDGGPPPMISPIILLGEVTMLLLPEGNPTEPPVGKWYCFVYGFLYFWKMIITAKPCFIIIDRVYVSPWRSRLRGPVYVLAICSIGAPLDGTYGVVQGWKTCSGTCMQVWAYSVHSQYVVQSAQDALAKGLYSQKEGRQIEVACLPVQFQHISFCPMPYMVRYKVLNAVHSAIGTRWSGKGFL